MFSDIKKFPTTKGVYIIRNLKNLKSYIGSSNNIRNRILDHVNNLKNRKHRNKHLQGAVDKYGLENFSFSVLDHYSEFPLEEVEQAFIDGFKSDDSKFGYNKTPAGRPPSLKGVPKTIEHNRKNGLSKMGSKNPNYGKRPSQKIIDKLIAYNLSTKKEYQFVSPIGEIISFVGLAEFCRMNNLSNACMSKVYSGSQNKHKGWRKYPLIKVVYKYKRKLSTGDVKEIYHLYKTERFNQKELAAKFNVAPSSIKKALNRYTNEG